MRVSTVENFAIDRTRFRTFCFRSIRFNPVVSIAISRRSVYHPPRCYSEEWKATRRRGWTLRKSCTHAVTRCAARRKSPWFAKPRVSITTRENLRVTRFSSTRISLSRCYLRVSRCFVRLSLEITASRCFQSDKHRKIDRVVSFRFRWRGS